MISLSDIKVGTQLKIGIQEAGYRMYSNKRSGRLFNFGILRVGAYSRLALIRRWAFQFF